MLPMFQGSFAQAEQLGKITLRKGDLLPNRLDIDIIWDMHVASVVFAALGERQRLSGALDHSLTRSLVFSSSSCLPSRPVGLNYLDQNSRPRLWSRPSPSGDSRGIVREEIVARSKWNLRVFGIVLRTTPPRFKSLCSWCAAHGEAHLAG